MTEPAKNTHVYQTYLFVNENDYHPKDSCMQDTIWIPSPPSENFTINVRARGFWDADVNGTMEVFLINSDGSLQSHGLIANGLVAGGGSYGPTQSIAQSFSGTISMGYFVQFSSFIGLVEFQIWTS